MTVRLEKETFGPVLRAARERRGVTLKQLAAETKLSVGLWEALKTTTSSRWPKRVFARSYVRDYAARVGLDADEMVNEFCRLFPEWGDRRAERVIREKAQIIAHDLDWEDLAVARQPTLQRPRGQRRARVRRGAHRTRLLAIAIDSRWCLGLGYLGRIGGLGVLDLHRRQRPVVFVRCHVLRPAARSDSSRRSGFSERSSRCPEPAACSPRAPKTHNFACFLPDCVCF